jgi:hypothetical protein
MDISGVYIPCHGPTMFLVTGGAACEDEQIVAIELVVV